MGFLTAILYWVLAILRTNALLLLAFLLGGVIARNQERRAARAKLRTKALSLLTDADAATLTALLGALPPWVHQPEFERVAWLNSILAGLWPFVNEARPFALPRRSLLGAADPSASAPRATPQTAPRTEWRPVRRPTPLHARPARCRTTKSVCPPPFAPRGRRRLSTSCSRS